MSRRIARLSAATALIAAIPALASAQSIVYSTSPVSITTCSVNDEYAPELAFNQGVQRLISSDIELNFINRNNVPATTVTIVVQDGRHTQSLIDKGTFAHDVPIEHFFTANNVGAHPNATCSVAEVDFADGTVWHSASLNIAQN